MAIGVQNFSKKDTSNPTAYPNGIIKDNPGDGSGTDINVNTSADIFAFFDKLLRMAGITANNKLDNETNGYQYITALLEATATIPAWTPAPSLGTQWATTSNTPQYTKDPSGRVYLQGAITSTGSSPASTVFNLPAGYRPIGSSTNVSFPCTAINATSGAYYTAYINVNSAGDVFFVDATKLPTASGWILELNTITFLTQ